MKKLIPYAKYLENLARSFVQEYRPSLDNAVALSIDGEACERLRTSISLDRRRRTGTFFTGSTLANFALKDALSTVRRESVIVDPACGAGNLLLAASAQLRTSNGIDETLQRWTKQILGIDTNSTLVRIAKTRLLLAALARVPRADRILKSNFESFFNGITKGDGLNSAEVLEKASHVFINPPFLKAKTNKDCEWASGTSNAAALFLEYYVKLSKPGTRIVAILPDVLRSGSGYTKWRDVIAKDVIVHKTRVYGRFDANTDIDVFVFDATVKKSTSSSKSVASIWALPARSRSKTVSDYFEIFIGPVVANRDPHKGPWYQYVDTGSVAPWTILRNSPKRRRFKGSTFQPPFVVIRRTSSPADKHRVTASVIIIGGKSRVAVENHLVVLKPKFGGIGECIRFMNAMKSESVTKFMNQRIRCRHLTVSSLASLPYSANKNE